MLFFKHFLNHNFSPQRRATMIKVLLVEDEKDMQRLWEIFLKRYYTGEEKLALLHAFSLDEAEKLFGNHPDITIIVMDACVPGRSPNTHALVKSFRRYFQGPMIAVSGVPRYQEELMDAGCSHMASKSELPAKVLEILQSL